MCTMQAADMSSHCQHFAVSRLSLSLELLPTCILVVGRRVLEEKHIMNYIVSFVARYTTYLYFEYLHNVHTMYILYSLLLIGTIERERKSFSSAFSLRLLMSIFKISVILCFAYNTGINILPVRTGTLRRRTHAH